MAELPLGAYFRELILLVRAHTAHPCLGDWVSFPGGAQAPASEKQWLWAAGPSCVFVLATPTVQQVATNLLA